MVTASVLDVSAIEVLRAGFRGQLLQSDDAGYDAARAVWNGMIDRRPAVIARCVGVADVIAAVEFARSNELVVSVRGGGHNVTGNAVCDGGLMIDLSPMKGVHVDPVRRVARAEAGVTWADFDHETQAFGLATTGGQVSTTGIAGLTLGGGMGWLQRSFGLVVDNLLSVDLVLADGKFVTASADQNQDLFWALRGGGGNFGVATSFEYRLHELGPIVMSGMGLYPAAQAPEILRFYRQFTADAPDQLMVVAGLLTAPPAPFVPEHLQGTLMVALVVCYAGPVEDGQPAVEAIRAAHPPAVDIFGPMPYTAVQRLFDAGLPFGQRVYLRSDHLASLSDRTIDAIVDNARQITSPASVAVIVPLGGAVARIGETETAFGHRDTPYDIDVFAIWTDPAEDERHIAWGRAFGAALQPFSRGVYVNELGNDGPSRIRDAYPTQIYDRLAKLKATYDPTNFFHLNQNIKPAGSSGI